MRRTDSAHKLLYLWPGLPDLWQQGRGLALAIALLYGVSLNVLLVLTFVWPEWLRGELSPGVGPRGAVVLAGTLKCVGWIVLGCCWVGSMVAQARLKDAPGRLNPSPVDESLFPRAQSEYLKGHWFEAETLIHELITQNNEDVEARLLLASVYRRSRRWADAERELRELEQFPAAARWAREMAVERKQLASLARPGEAAEKAA